MAKEVDDVLVIGAGVGRPSMTCAAATTTPHDRAVLDRPPPTRIAGAEGLLVFLLIDMMFFALMLVAFAVGRATEPLIFAQGRQTLDVTLGMSNTMVLLASSWAVAVSVRAAERGASGLRMIGMLAAMGLGLVFVAIKLHEYTSKIAAGITMMTSEFFTWYFAITGLHFLHVIGGLIALLVVVLKVRSAPGATVHLQESVGLFWHMVDLLWVMLFPILYVL